MDINKEIIMTIVENSKGRLEYDQEFFEINEEQLHIISKELNKLFSLNGVMHPLPSKEEMTLELNTMLTELNKDVKPSYLKRSVLKGVEIGFKKCYEYVTGNCA